MSTHAPSSVPPPPSEARFGAQEMLQMMVRRRGLIVKIALVTVAATAALMFYLPTLYSTSAVVMLDQRKNNVADVSSVLSAMPTDPASVQNQIQVLSSRDLALKVIAKLHLDADPEFNSALGRGLPDLNPLHLLRAGRGGRPADVLDGVVNNFLNRLDVSSLGLSTSIQVGFTSRDPAKAARIANTLARLYTDEQIAIKVRAARQAAGWLSDRMHQLSQQVQQQESAVLLYKAEHDLVESADGRSLVDAQLLAINAQLIQARSDLDEKHAAYDRVAALTRTGNGADITQVVTSKMIGDLRTQEAELVRQEAELTTRYGPNHPRMLAIHNERRDLATKITREVAGIAGAMQSEVEVARSHVGSIEASLARVERQARQENMARVKLKALEANLASTRATYESFIARLRAVQDQDNIQVPESRVISTAPVPASPSAPHRTLFIGASIPGGLLLGLLFALLLERFSATAGVAAPVVPRRERQPARPAMPQATPAYAASQPPSPLPSSSTPVLHPPPLLAELAASPDIRLADWVLEHPASPYGRGLTAILSALLPLRRNQALVVTLTAVAPDATQPVTALALARMAAKGGLRTLLIDADSGRLAPAISGSGLAAMLSGTPFATAAQADRRSPAYMLSAPPMVWPHANTAGVIGGLRGACDLIVIDAVAPGTAGAWPALARLSDAVVLISAAAASQTLFERTLRSLVAMGAPLCGLVITR
jgi:polysaccharide biosynthesis transport protein